MRLYVFVNTWCVIYWTTVLLIICFLVYFYYVKVRRATFLYYCPNLVSKALVCFLTIKAFLPDLYHSFSLSYCRVASKIILQSKFLVFSRLCIALVSLICMFLWSSFVYLKNNSQHSQADDRVSQVGYQESNYRWWHSGLLPCSNVALCLDSAFLSWNVCCGSTSPRDV